MKRTKAGIALITLFGLLFGTAGIASAKTASHLTKTSHVVSQHVSKKSVHKSVKQQAKKSAKLTSQHITKNA